MLKPYSLHALLQKLVIAQIFSHIWANFLTLYYLLSITLENSSAIHC